MPDQHGDTVAGAEMRVSTPRSVGDAESINMAIPSNKPTFTHSKPPTASTNVAKTALNPLAKLVPGYPKLSGRMAHFPTMAMFRRVGALNARNILYLQSDLQHVEEQLIELENQDDRDKRGDKSQYEKDHHWLRSALAMRDGDTK